MIPQKLQLKNFLSYGSSFQTIDFGGHQLICLSGKNGHGKSALLDAITWAIWGQARKTSGTSKPDAQLLRLGQTHMVVIFDFYFNGATYRIRREYSETYNKPYAALDFATIDPDTKKSIPLTDKTIRDTQAKIEQTVGLDFESFINSAFLRQGQANEFSKKSPKERKDILANILNLQQYESIRKLATEKTKQATIDLQITNQLVERLNNELSETATLGAELQKLTDQLAELEIENSAKNSQLAHFNEQRKQHEQMVQQANLLTFKKNQLLAQKNEREQLLSTQFAYWRQINKQLRNLAGHESIDTQKEQLLTTINTMQQQLHTSLQLKEQYLNLKEQEQQLLKQLHDAHSIQMQRLAVQYERLKVEREQLITVSQNYARQAVIHETEIQRIDQKLSAPSSAQNNTELAQQEKQFEKRKSYYQLWAARLQTITDQLIDLAHKKKLVQESDNPCCPLCEQNLSASRKRFLKIKFIKLKQSYQHRSNRLSLVLKQLKTVLISQHEQLTRTKQQEIEQQKQNLLQQELVKQKNRLLEELSQHKQNNENNNNAIARNEAELIHNESARKLITQEFESSLMQHEPLNALKKRITECQNHIQANSFDAQRHAQLLDQLKQIEHKKEQHAKLLQEKNKQPERFIYLQQLCAELRTIKNQLQDINKQLVSCEQQMVNFASIEQQTQHALQQLDQLRKQKDEILLERGRLERSKEQRSKNEQELQKHQHTMTLLQQTITEYQIIASALGKEGIQALLIEEALPEIEQETNLLLAQLTNNQAHIFIDSLRDLKKGGTKETLDIKISDAMGIRPYELFSGGEAFRIDFALRIAISKLLARRAGTSLQTLIIDEGFGSQDDEGIGHLMDAIHKIQDHFAKVIIVSHLPILKEQFPVHFLVEKGPQGSAVRVIENG